MSHNQAKHNAQQAQKSAIALKKKLVMEYNKHWFVRSLAYKPPDRPKRLRKIKSLPGQQTLFT